MRRGTTPTVLITVSNEDGTPLDLTGHELHVTFDDGYRQLTKRETDVQVTVDGDTTVIGVSLTQAETLSFSEKRHVRVQVRCKALGIATATDIAVFKAEEILLEGEI